MFRRRAAHAGHHGNRPLDRAGAAHRLAAVPHLAEDGLPECGARQGRRILRREGGEAMAIEARQHWAAPGGWHDRKIKLLAVVLPGLVGMVAAGFAGAAPAATAPSTSPLVTRPSLPVPLILLGSMPSSRTRRRTEGESGRSLFSTCATGMGAAVVVIAGAIAAATGAGAGADALFPASMDPITAPTLTVAPSSTA